MIPAQLALPLVENGGARSRFHIEVGQNLYAIACRTIVPTRTRFLQATVGEIFIDPPAWLSRRVERLQAYGDPSRFVPLRWNQWELQTFSLAVIAL